MDANQLSRAGNRMSLTQITKPEPQTLALPELLKEQAEDVNFALNAFFGLRKKGVLFTNSTGTGKTHLGYGVIRAFARLGKRTALVLAPTQAICVKWLDLLCGEGVDASIAEDTSGIPSAAVVITTYANFHSNLGVFSRTFDLIVCDESHYLMKNLAGQKTQAIEALRAVSGHDRGLTTRIKAVGELRSSESITADHELAKLGTNVLFLSASPFAYVKNIDYAEGYLFEYGPEPDCRGYNTPTASEQFYITNFGYRMRCGKLCRPEAGVDCDYMEQSFNERLKREGVLSHRALDVDVDYSRDFISVDSGIGRLIDEGLKALSTTPFRYLSSGNKTGIFSNHNRAQLLEAIKAEFVVERIREHIKLGRKVVVYHSYLKDALEHPFHFAKEEGSFFDNPAKFEYNNAVDLFSEKHPEYTRLDLGRLKSALSILTDEFPSALLFNGKVPSKKRVSNMAKFNDADSGCNLIIVQERAGREGVDFHDTKGDQPRVLMNLSVAADPLACIQLEGRTRRFGTKSNAIYEYFNTGTSFEVNTYATTIASRSRVAENLAVGLTARNLKDIFLNGYLYSSSEAPSLNQGIGGKHQEGYSTQKDEWSIAKGLYYATEKRNSRTKGTGGLDFFATPEPLGLFMTCLSKPKKNKNQLEPSAGNGSIAMWSPRDVNLYCVEPSAKLMGELKLRVGRELRDINTTFEEYTHGPRFHSITMNPPFGKNSKLAGDHLAHAITKLAEMGTAVALVPDSPSMNKRIDALTEELNQRFIAIHQQIKLPSCVFQRAGTSVSTKLVILKRHTKSTWFRKRPTKIISDFAQIESISDLFDALQEYVEINGLMIQSAEVDPENRDNQAIELNAEPLPLVVTNVADHQATPLAGEQNGMDSFAIDRSIIEEPHPASCPSNLSQTDAQLCLFL